MYGGSRLGGGGGVGLGQRNSHSEGEQADRYSGYKKATEEDKNKSRPLSLVKQLSEGSLPAHHLEPLFPFKAALAKKQVSEPAPAVKPLESAPVPKTANPKDRPCRRVSFHQLKVREYEVTIGDNPSTTSGVPIQLGWKVNGTYECSLDAYEKARGNIRHRRADEMRVPPDTRKAWLSDEHSESQINDAEKQRRKARSERQFSIAMQDFEHLAMAWESIQRKLKKMRKPDDLDDPVVKWLHDRKKNKGKRALRQTASFGGASPAEKKAAMLTKKATANKEEDTATENCSDDSAPSRPPPLLRKSYSTGSLTVTDSSLVTSSTSAVAPDTLRTKLNDDSSDARVSI